MLIISDDGTIIRMGAGTISTFGRSTQGVRLMRLADGSKVISVAKTDKEDAEISEEDTLEAANEDSDSDDAAVETAPQD